MHKCNQEKCVNCFLFTKTVHNNTVEITCNSNYIKNTHFQCKFCNKIIENKKCQERHEKLNRNQCIYTMFCKLCQKHYSKTSKHECGKKFCNKCLTYHPSQLFCSTRSIKRKSVKKEPFLCDIKFENGVPYIFSICQYENGKEIVIYQFTFSCNFYTKQVISRNNFNTISVESFQFESKFDIEHIIQELDIINLKPMFLFDNDDFEFLMNTLDLEFFELSTKNNNVNKMVSKFYTVLL